jgi:hypothetical protein
LGSFASFRVFLKTAIMPDIVSLSRGACVVSEIIDQQKSTKPAENVGEIYFKGKWIRVPTLNVDDRTIVIKGKWLKIAFIRSEDWLATELQDPENCIRRLKEEASSGLRADIFTFTQKLPATNPKFPYPMEWDSVAAVRLESFEGWWDSLPQETRKNVRRAQKRGVVVTVKPFDDDLIREVVALNNDTPMRQGRRNDQFGGTFDQVKKDYSSFLDRSDCICTYHGTELIGFLKVVYRGNIAALLNILPNPRHADKRPANALIAKAFELCAEKGMLYVTYGMFNYGNKRDSPLREFKVRNGFQEVLVPRYYVPLTAWGKVCMKAKLHRGILSILPHSVITFANKVRSKWYNSK